MISFKLSSLKLNFIANIAGSILDKSLILIIAFFLSKYISKSDFGLWSQYLQLILIFSAAVISPIQLFFSREYFSKKQNPLVLYNSFLVFFIFIFFIFFLYFFYFELIDTIFLLKILLSIFTYVLYMLNSSYLRFNKKDFLYMKLSAFRLIIFLTVIFFQMFQNKFITYNDLVNAYFLAHVAFLYSLRNNIKISFKLNKKNINEYLRLLIYGVTTMLLSGVDKVIVTKFGYSYTELGYYAYAIAISSIPSFLTEGVKQYLQPMLFKDLSDRGDYSKKTRYTIIKFVFALIIIQLILPFISFELLKWMEMFQYDYDFMFYKILFLLNVAFCFHIVYHFINPYLFFYDRSLKLLFIQIISISVFIFLLSISIDLDNFKLSIYRLTMYFFLLLLTFISFLSRKNNKKTCT